MNVDKTNYMEERKVMKNYVNSQSTCCLAVDVIFHDFCLLHVVGLVNVHAVGDLDERAHGVHVAVDALDEPAHSFLCSGQTCAVRAVSALRLKIANTPRVHN